jgi:hypothetical protein
LIFDLAFVWHVFIKNEAAESYFEERLHETDGLGQPSKQSLEQPVTTTIPE